MSDVKFGRTTRLGVCLAILLIASGCATTPSEDADPIEGVNREFYGLNDYLDVNFVKPIAEGYVKITPAPVRSSVTNFFDNVSYINVILNDILQGKMLQGIQDSGRFVINSTVGVLGLFDVASRMGLKANDEDLGQTFGKWGFGEGAYLVIPLGGPNSVRDAPDMLVSSYLNPLFYASSTITIPLGIVNAINKRANLLDASRIRDEAALDPYVFTREAYRQSRIYSIYDGNPPTEDFEDMFEEDFEELDEFDEELIEDQDSGELQID
jgi:phospholipid-binding lipoprotein MlaA